jgi:hypothetical protein
MPPSSADWCRGRAGWAARCARAADHDLAERIKTVIRADARTRDLGDVVPALRRGALRRQPALRWWV